nr:hypothetical protein [uncultured Mediterranean phage uvMED]
MSFITKPIGGAVRSVGSAFGIGGGSSAPNQVGTQVTTQARDVPDYLKDDYQFAVQQARDLYDTPQQLFEGSYTVPFSDVTQQGLDQATQLAQAGDPLNQASTDLATQRLQGNFLTGDMNPYFNQAVETAINPVISTVQSQFSRGGRLGSDANQEVLARAIGDITAPLAFANYNNELDRQMQTQRLAPTISEGRFADSQRLMDIGGILEGQQAQELQEDIMRSQFARNEESDRLNELLRNITGATYGGTTTASAPIYGQRQNSFLNPLGILSTAGSLFGGLLG